MRTQIALALGLAAAAAQAAPPPAPNAASALLERARLWDDRNRPQQAREVLQKLFRIAPDHPDGLATLALIEARADRPAMAQAALDKLRKARPDHPAIPAIEMQLRLNGPDKLKLAQARQLARQARLDGRRDQRPKALAAYRALFRGAKPEGDLALEYWQLVAEDWDAWDEARTGLTELTKKHPDSLRYRYALAEHETTRLPMNAKALQTVIDMTRLPQFERQARAAWRRAMLRLEPAQEAAGLIEAYLEREPNDSVVREHLTTLVAALETRKRQPPTAVAAAGAAAPPSEGLALLDKGDLAAAEVQLERELRQRPDDAELLGGLGLIRLRQGHHAQAQGLFQQARRLQPDQAARWQGLVDTTRFWGLMREARDARGNREFALAEDKLREALTIDPREAQAWNALARVQADRRQVAAAEASYRRALDIAPTDRDALGELLELLARDGRRDEARRMLAELAPAQRAALDRDLDTIEAGLLRAEADGLLAAGKADEAQALLEKAVGLDPDDPWLRYALGRLYLSRQEAGRGMALLDALLARRPGDAGALYAKALLQSAADQSLQALATLEQVPTAQRDTKLAQFQRELWLGLRLEQVRAARRAGRDEAARGLLENAGTALGSDGQLLPRLARAWVEMGEPLRALALLAELRGSGAPTADALLAEAEIQAELGRPAAVRTILAQLPPSRETEALERRTGLIERAVLQAARGAEAAAAEQALIDALAELGERPELLRALAARQARDERAADAEATLRRLLAAQPESIPARADLVRALLRQQRPVDATVEEILARSAAGELPALLACAELLVEAGLTAPAQRLLDALATRAADQARWHLLAGRLAQQAGREDEALAALQRGQAIEQREAAQRMTVLRTRPAPSGAVVDLEISAAPAAAPASGSSYGLKQLAGLIDRRAGWLSLGYDRRERVGTPGYSDFRSDELAAEAVMPVAGGERWFLRADTVKLRAGRLAATDARSFGSLALCSGTPAGCRTAGNQTAEGIGLALGWQGQTRRIDLGLSPRDFAVDNWVGGFVEKGDLGPFSWSADLSRRAVTSSLLSWAGTRDPRSGRTWGGVVASGLRLGLSHDQGGTLGFWSSLGTHRLTGQHVDDNTRLQLMAGGYWRIVNQENHLLSLGLTGMQWKFDKNAGEYTLGHGGYYSPASYRSLAVPITWAQRFARFSYSLRAASSWSRARTDGAAYYPEDPAMQAGVVDGTYTASAGNPPTSKGWSFHMGWEYQMDPRLFLGGRVEIERSPDYAPDRYLFYVRFNLDRPAAQPVPLSPDPFLPYSQF